MSNDNDFRKVEKKAHTRLDPEAYYARCAKGLSSSWENFFRYSADEKPKPFSKSQDTLLTCPECYGGQICNLSFDKLSRWRCTHCGSNASVPWMQSVYRSKDVSGQT